MPALSDAERQEWRDANADVIQFVSDEANTRSSQFVRSIRGSYVQWGSLTGPQTAAIRNVMREMTSSAERGISEAAEGHEAASVPNGTFTVTYAGQHHSFQIYTARRGPLAGKRLVKRRTDDGWKGFAFLTRDCDLRMWRRFYEDEAAGAAYIYAARGLVWLLATGGRPTNDTEFNIESDFEDQTWRIQASTVCRVCNRQLTDPTSIELGIGPDCRRDRGESADRATSASLRSLLDSVTVVASEDIAEDDLIDIPAYVAPSSPTYTTLNAHQRAILAVMNNEPNEYRQRPCEYCGRHDFMQPQGRGRHRTSCARRHNDRTIVERYPSEVNRLRGIRDNTRNTVRPVRRGPSSATINIARTIPTPNLSMLGTRIGGAVWEQ